MWKLKSVVVKISYTFLFEVLPKRIKAWVTPLLDTEEAYGSFL